MFYALTLHSGSLTFLVVRNKVRVVDGEVVVLLLLLDHDDLQDVFALSVAGVAV